MKSETSDTSPNIVCQLSKYQVISTNDLSLEFIYSRITEMALLINICKTAYYLLSCTKILNLVPYVRYCMIHIYIYDYIRSVQEISSDGFRLVSLCGEGCYHRWLLSDNMQISN